MASQNTRALSAVPPERQAQRQAATQGLMKRAMERSAEACRGRSPCFPPRAYASEARMSLEAFEDFYFGACLADEDGGAWKRQSERPNGSRSGSRGGARSVRGEGPTSGWGSGIAPSSPPAESTGCPTASSSRPSRGLGRGGSASTSRPATAAARYPGSFRFQGQGGEHLGGEGERFLIEMLDTDEGRSLGDWDRHQLRDQRQRRRDPPRREDRRHRPPRGRALMSRDQRRQRVAVHRTPICDLRRGGRIEVDGETLQEDGLFVV